MNGNQKNHVTLMWTWRRGKQGLGFIAHLVNVFHTMPMPCTVLHSEAPMSHILNSTSEQAAVNGSI